MKHLFFTFISLFILFSCTQEENILITDTKLQTELPIAGCRVINEPILISKRELDKTEIFKLTSKSDNSYISTYNKSTPIYRYIYYSATNTDHLFTKDNSPKLSHDNINYTLESQEFNLMPYKEIKTTTLYRLYSPTLKRHMLSLNSSVDSYKQEELIGYIFTEQQVGTVPLKEYYSAKRNNYHYVSNNVEIEDWIPEKEPDFTYTKIIGYVYPGARIDAKKKATTFIISNISRMYYPTNVILTVNIREGGSYRELKYSVQMPNANESVKFPINNTYTVISADIALTSNIFSQVTNIFSDITNPTFKDIMQSIGGAFYMELLKPQISGYEVTYTYQYDIAVGNEK